MRGLQEWISRPTNMTLVVALVATGIGFYTAVTRGNGTALAFAGSMWVVWSTVLKERNRHYRADDEDEDEHPDIHIEEEHHKHEH